MTQAVVTSIGRVRMPTKMLRAYKHSTNENRALFDMTYARLTESGLNLYPTDCPDFRARHPQNDIVFVVLGFQEVAGTRIEIRIDSLPKSIWASNQVRPRRIVQYDRNSRAYWAVYPIDEQSNLDAVVLVIERVVGIRPMWGNVVLGNTECKHLSHENHRNFGL